VPAPQVGCPAEGLHRRCKRRRFVGLMAAIRGSHQPHICAAQAGTPVVILNAGAIDGSHFPGLRRHRQARTGTLPQPGMPSDLHKRFSSPFLAAHGKEKVYGSIP